MERLEKIALLKHLCDANSFREEEYYKALEDMGDLKINYHDYMITEPLNCDDELK